MRRIYLILFLAVSLNLFSQNYTTDTLRMSERIETIQSMLDNSKSGVNLWWYGWLGAYSMATVAQGVVCFTSENLATRQDMILGAGTTLLGAVFQAITPLNTGKDAGLLAQMSDSTLELKLKKLEMAEGYLRVNALKEKSGRSWQIHALNTAVNLGSGLITWLGFKRSVWDGVGNFLMNSAVTELQIWTQPTKTMKDYRNYKQKYIDNQVTSNKTPPEYVLKAYPGGVSFAIVF